MTGTFHVDFFWVKLLNFSNLLTENEDKIPFLPCLQILVFLPFFREKRKNKRKEVRKKTNIKWENTEVKFLPPPSNCRGFFSFNMPLHLGFPFSNGKKMQLAPNIRTMLGGRPKVSNKSEQKMFCLGNTS